MTVGHGAHMSRTTLFQISCNVCASRVLLWPAGRADAQGVTTGAISGVVKDAQGAVIPGATILAVHQPSGSTYEAVTQADGRFVIPGMRVGGPYTITASLPGFTSEAKNNMTVSLGVTQDLDFTLRVANVAETITVVGHERSGVQLGTHRRRHRRDARGSRVAADDYRAASPTSRA